MRHYAKTIRSLTSFIKASPFLVAQKLFSVIAYKLISLLPPIAAAGIVAAATEGNFNAIWPYVAACAIFFLLYFASCAWSMYTYTVLDDFYYLTIQRRIFNHVAENEAILDEISHATIADTCSDDIQYIIDVVNDSCHTVANFIQLIIIFIIFAYYNILVATIALIIDLIYILLTNENSHAFARSYEGTRRSNDKIINILNQMLTNLKQVKSLDIMPALAKKLTHTENEWSDHYHRKRRLATIRECLIPLILYGGKLVIYILLAYLVATGQMPIDRLILLVSYYELIMVCTEEALDYLLNLSTNGVRIKRIKTILDYTQGDDFDYGDLGNDNIDGVVIFDDVYYSENRHPILQGVSFKALPNEITAIVGRQGAGKSAIISLLYRLNHVKSGSILIDDESIYNYSKKVYSSNVSGVFQTPFTFKMSIRDNLALADPDPKAQAKACRRVGLSAKIKSLPKGYNTILDDNNQTFTNAELQRLAIARALLTKSEILLFDDITSIIDPVSAQGIAELLDNLKTDHTIIVVTHQPEIMRVSDRVIVLKDGKISTKGANKAVLKRSKLYRQLAQV